MEPDYYGCLNCGGDGWLDELTYCDCQLGQDMKQEAALPATTERMYTVAEVAELLKLHPGHVRRLATKLQLGYRPSPRVLLFTAADLDAMRRRDRTPGPKGART